MDSEFQECSTFPFVLPSGGNFIRSRILNQVLFASSGKSLNAVFHVPFAALSCIGPATPKWEPPRAVERLSMRRRPAPLRIRD